MIHSCVEAYIADCFPVSVNIKQPCCCGSVAIWDTVCGNVTIADSIRVCYKIEDASNGTVYIQDTSTITIMMEWVCGTGYTEKYLRVTPTDVQWITVEYDVEYYVHSNTDWAVQ